MPELTAPIGIFDSGLGGLTVARAIASELPHESILYFGDTARCPYGVRPEQEIAQFVEQIVHWFHKHNPKVLVIACNTASAAGLAIAREMLDVPVIGVIEPGARAVVAKTKTKKVGVLATPATIKMDAYTEAIHAIDPEVSVHAAASPRSVEIVERSIVSPHAYGRDWMQDKAFFRSEENLAIVEEDLEPLRDKAIDAVILGCTHFPMLKDLYAEVMGSEVTIVSSAEETAKEVHSYLERYALLAPEAHEPHYHFVTTSEDVTGFCIAGEYVFGRKLKMAEHISPRELEELHENE